MKYDTRNEMREYSGPTGAIDYVLFTGDVHSGRVCNLAPRAYVASSVMASLMRAKAALATWLTWRARR